MKSNKLNINWKLKSSRCGISTYCLTVEGKSAHVIGSKGFGWFISIAGELQREEVKLKDAKIFAEGRLAESGAV